MAKFLYIHVKYLRVLQNTILRLLQDLERRRRRALGIDQKIAHKKKADCKQEYRCPKIGGYNAYLRIRM